MSQREVTPNGYLKATANFARTGIYRYLGSEIGVKDRPDHIFKVLRPASEVFSEDSLKTFSNLPVTLGHPESPLDAKNTKEHARGYSGDSVTRSDNYVRGNITIVDEDTIREVDSGNKQISLGYIADYEERYGLTLEGEDYDFIQKNIRGNHIAIVPTGRAGEDCYIFDSANKLEKSMEDTKNNKPTIKAEVQDATDKSTDDFDIRAMVQDMSDRLEKLEGKDKTSCDESAAEADRKDAKEDRKDGKEDKKDPKEAAKMRAKADKADIRADKDDEYESKKTEKKDTKDAGITMDAAVAALVDTREKAKVYTPSLVLDGKSAEQVKREVVSTYFKDESFEGKSADYIEARFDSIKYLNNTMGNTYVADQMSKAVGHRAGAAELTPAQEAFERKKSAYKGK